MALHTTVLHSTQVNGGRGSLRDLAESTIQQIENAIYENLVDKDCFLQRDPHGLSLWALFFAYHICAANIRRQSCFSSTVKEIRQTMTIINARWNVAGTKDLFFSESRLMCSGFRCIFTTTRGTGGFTATRCCSMRNQTRLEHRYTS